MFVYNAVGKLSTACEQERSIYRKSSIKPPGAYLIISMSVYLRVVQNDNFKI